MGVDQVGLPGAGPRTNTRGLSPVPFRVSSHQAAHRAFAVSLGRWIPP